MADLNNTNAKAQEALATAKEIALSVKDKVVAGGQALKASAVNSAAEARIGGAQEYLLALIKKNPYKSLGAAFLGGWLCSKCWRNSKIIK